MSFRFRNVDNPIPIRYHLSGDIEVCRRFLAVAKKKQYKLIEFMRFRKLSQMVSTSHFPGCTISNSSNFGINDIFIRAEYVSGRAERPSKHCFCFCKVSAGLVISAPTDSEHLVNGVLVKDYGWVPQADDVYTVEVCKGYTTVVYENIKRTDFYPHYKGDTVLLVAQDLASANPTTDILYENIPECNWNLWRITSLSGVEVGGKYGSTQCLHSPPLKRCKFDISDLHLCCHKAKVTGIDCSIDSGSIDIEWESTVPSHLASVTNVAEARYYSGLGLTNKVDAEPYITGFINNQWLMFSPDDIVLVVEQIGTGDLIVIAHSDNLDDNDPMVMDGGGSNQYLQSFNGKTNGTEETEYLVSHDNYVYQVDVDDVVADDFNLPGMRNFQVRISFGSAPYYRTDVETYINNNYLNGESVTIGVGWGASATHDVDFTFGSSYNYPRSWGITGTSGKTNLVSVYWADFAPDHANLRPVFSYLFDFVQYDNTDTSFYLILKSTSTYDNTAPTTMYGIQFVPVFNGVEPLSIDSWSANSITPTWPLSTYLFSRTYIFSGDSSESTTTTTQTHTASFNSLLAITSEQSLYILATVDGYSSKEVYKKSGNQDLANGSAYLAVTSSLVFNDRDSTVYTVSTGYVDSSSAIVDNASTYTVDQRVTSLLAMNLERGVFVFDEVTSIGTDPSGGAVPTTYRLYVWVDGEKLLIDEQSGTLSGHSLLMGYNVSSNDSYSETYSAGGTQPLDGSTVHVGAFGTLDGGVSGVITVDNRIIVSPDNKIIRVRVPKTTTYGEFWDIIIVDGKLITKEYDPTTFTYAEIPA